MNIQIKEKKTFEPVPEGVYPSATILEATESADGQYIQMRIDVGSENGCVFDRLYADNAVRARFICDAIGKTWDGTVSAADLINKTCSIDVSIVEKNGKTFNKILTWKAAESAPAPAPTASPSKTISPDDIPF
jgi:hypothetical protein